MFDEETQKELMQEFFSENREALDRIEQGILHLESDPFERQTLNNIFRDMHTVKGNCRMMGFTRLEELTHAAETLLDQLRDGTLIFNQKMSSALLGVLDSVRLSLQKINQQGSEDDKPFHTQIANLEKLLLEQKIKETMPFEFCENDQEMGADTKNQKKGFMLHLEEPTTPLSSSIGNGAETPNTTSDSIRLSIDRLETLLNLVSELSSTFNQLKYIIAHNPEQIEHILEGHGAQLYRLQEEILQYRLQPIGHIWNSYHRLVRDLAVATGKKVVLDLEGEETEVDRQILVSIKEMLGHIIRNAVDHGIEPPENRTDKGKPIIGRVTLTAQQKHGQIYLEIADDGRGIDVEKVRKKALAQELITPDQASEMKESDLFKLIMTPGFSTADQVSKISGRGTGMDVVQTALDKVGGSLSISSTPDLGTRFCMRIPQTMAIVMALLVKSSGETYAIPQVNIVELISFYKEEIQKNIEGKMQYPMVRVRHKLLPLISLEKTLACHDNRCNMLHEMKRIQTKQALHVVVLQVEENIFGLEVEKILEPSSLVIKPLNRIFSHISILAGMTVLPDGTVSFLLNVPELIHLNGSEK
ncbi:MAG: chemotaxis protein CheA [Magnetococcus sp. DMHC-6]